MFYKGYSGVTLLELLVVVIIVGVLAGIGVVNFTASKERALGQEAKANLKLIAAAESIYRMEGTSYYPSGTTETSITNINNNLRLSLTENNWDYAVSGGATFSAFAYRQGSGGFRNYLDCVYRITSSLDDPVAVDAANCP